MEEMIKQREYNTGVSVLKIWMVMSIVVCHFLNTESPSKLSHIFTIYGGVGVSVFVFLSFLLSDVVFSKDCKRIGHRCYRLFLPQCFWAIIYFITYSIMIFPTNDVMCSEDCSIRGLLWQLALGATLNPPMWYLADMLILTVFFCLIFMSFKNENGIIISIVVAGIAIVMQYSGFNYRLCCNLPYYSKWTLGRLVELIPIAVVGIVFSYYKIMNKLFNHRLVASVLCLIILPLIYKLNIFNYCDGFYYQGLYQVVVAICLGSLFYCLPFDKLPRSLKAFINNWSRYNMGIIAMHYMVKAFYNNIANEVRRLSLLECLLIYVIALGISIIGTRIPIKHVRNAFS